jgi:hypothetical protein
MSIKNFLVRIGVAGLALTATAGVYAALPAEAAQRPQSITTCGQAITKASAYLARDLTCTQGFNISSAASPEDISIDLRGHRLQGPGSGTAVSVGGEVPYVASLELKNGRLDHWGTAVSSTFASTTLTNVTLDHNALALHCAAGNCTVSNSRIENNTVGTTSIEAGLVFNDNVFRGNGTASEASSLGEFSGATYTDNSFEANTVGVSIAPNIQVNLIGNRFTQNVVGVKGTDPDGAGVFFAGLTNNWFEKNRDGINFALNENSGDAVLKGNVAVKNTRYGIYAPGAVDAGGNAASRNGRPCVGVVCDRP